MNALTRELVLLTVQTVTHIPTVTHTALLDTAREYVPANRATEHIPPRRDTHPAAQLPLNLQTAPVPAYRNRPARSLHTREKPLAVVPQGHIGTPVAQETGTAAEGIVNALDGMFALYLLEHTAVPPPLEPDLHRIVEGRRQQSVLIVLVSRDASVAVTFTDDMPHAVVLISAPPVIRT
ncbi:Uncharacterised protein [Porphyromonas macacae]|uniref:Uncharacterized protein n=1 Tax=Porphyromonas macacae TaxID=28115 RepID=A0A379EG93_9PORP|nr:Uncharacterised protein [Porphyromonas macacae]